jgi:flagellar hook-associated protein 2
MATLTLPGLSSGIDTSVLITQLMTIESRRLATYQVKQKSYDAQITALEGVRTKVSALKSATTALADADNLDIFSTSSSDTDKLTISASSEANPGSHSIEVNQLATTETWIQDTSTFSYKTDYVGDGEFVYTYNHQSRAITTVEDETTLQDLVNLINNDSNNPGVTASLLYHGGKYHLMLSGREAGEDYQISVDSKYTEVWKSDTGFTDGGANAGLTTKITELDQFTLNAGFKGDEKIIISGKNHFGTDLADKELDITANTTVGQLIDAINEQFDGVATARLVNGQIWLTDHNSDTSGLYISLDYDVGDGNTELIPPMMDVSTEGGGTPTITPLGSFSQTQSAQSSNIKIDGYPSTETPEEQRLTLGSVATYAEGAHFHLTYNGQTTEEIAYNASTGVIQAALEALSNVDEGDIVVEGDRLDQSSTGYTSFKFLSPAGDVQMISIDASELTFSDPEAETATFAETVKGSNGYIERNSNSISDALSGVTLNLHDVTETNTPVKITISRNTSTVSKKINTMVTAYNDLITELKTNTEYNSSTKKMGILSNDMGVSLIKSQSYNPFVGAAAGFIATIDSFVQASDIGLTFDGAGMIQFDSSIFNDAINEDFNSVLDLLGATKTSNNESGVIQFYAASEKYTTAGTYDIEVDINDSHQIEDVRIKLSTEPISAFRSNSTWSNNLVTGIVTFDDNGDPVYPENGLQFTVDLTQLEDTYTSTISVKQGIVGALDEFIGKILETDGRLDISKDVLNEKSAAMEKKIENEQKRLDTYKQRLVDKYARLEKTLTMLQQQMGAISQITSAISS